MNDTLDDVLNPSSYLLSQDGYDNLCTIRDRIELLGRLAGNASISGDTNAVLLIPRAMIGELFLALSAEMGEVLVATGSKAVPAARTPTH